jgi:hypothetical protein
MTSFFSGEPTFPVKIVFGTGDDAVRFTLHADGTFDGDPAALRDAMERARGRDHHAAVITWLVLREMERGVGGGVT